MTGQKGMLVALALTSAVSLAAMMPAQALTMQECSAKYQSAQKAGSLNGKNWNDFRKAECSVDAATTVSGKSAEAKTSESTSAEAKTERKTKTAAKKPAGNAVFPKAVDAKYAKETAGKSRLHTCADQYKANKADNANGGLRWIQKGGGYYSECSKKLKGSA